MILLIFSGIYSSNGIYAQDTSDSDHIYFKDSLQQHFQSDFNIFKTNPLTVLWGSIPFTSEYRITYETSTGRKQYANIGAAYLGKNVVLLKGYASLISNPEAYKFNGYKVHFSYRWIIHEFGPHPEGIYVGPYISYAHLRIENTQSAGISDHAIIDHFHIAAIMGAQIKLGGIFYGDVFGGIGYKNNNWDNHVKYSSQQLIDLDNLDYVYDYNIKIKIGFSLGIRI